MPFDLTPRQIEAQGLLNGPAGHVLLFGGSRSGKTALIIRQLAIRAMLAPKSRHVVLRHRFNHVKASVIFDTFPKIMSACFPEIEYKLDKTDWFARFTNGSEIWFGGLDDKERTEKILGQEHATVYLNEASQITKTARDMAMTRLAQKVEFVLDGQKRLLRLKAFYDCNPPSKGHWLYQMFVEKRDSDTRQPISRPEQYASMRLNPGDNRDNLPADYIAGLEALPARMRQRFLEGNFADVAENALWTLETLEKWRALGDLPDMQRIVIAVDPSGAGDEDAGNHDAVGIVVAGLGRDGNGYLLEDLTSSVGPGTWGNIVASAYDRRQADVVVAEQNFGGAMVQHVIQVARPRTPYRSVIASRGKAVRAEPIAALYESGRIRHAGYFHDLEDEFCAFTTAGYMGSDSPNRADAAIWAFTELFPGMVKPKPAVDKSLPRVYTVSQDANEGWLGS